MITCKWCGGHNINVEKVTIGKRLVEAHCYCNECDNLFHRFFDLVSDIGEWLKGFTGVAV